MEEKPFMRKILNESKQVRRERWDVIHPRGTAEFKYKDHILTKEEVKKIGKEYYDRGAYDLAYELNVSSIDVYQVVGKLRKAGVNIPSRLLRKATKLQNIAEAVEDLLEEQK